MHHVSTRFQNEGGSKVPLSTLELPFAYLEQGESKSALVKVVLCGKCVKKLMWKRTKEKEREISALIQDSRSPEADADSSKVVREINHEGEEIEQQKRKKRLRDEKEEKGRSARKRRTSHSRSPTRRQKEKADR